MVHVVLQAHQRGSGERADLEIGVEIGGHHTYFSVELVEIGGHHTYFSVELVLVSERGCR